MTFVQSTRNLSLIALLVASSSLVGCTKCSGRGEKARLAALQLDQAPAMDKSLNIAFGDQVTLLGYKLESPGELHPKDKVKITFYWRLDKDLPPGWRLSSRIFGEHGEVVLNADEIGPLRERRNRKQLLSPSDWAVGKIYVDEQVLRIPTKLPGRFVKVAAALRKADESLLPKSGEVDKRGYLTVAQIPVDVRRKARLVPQFAVPMLASTNKVTVDGVVDEAAWATALPIASLVDLKTGRASVSEGSFSAKAKVLWDEQSLYMAVEVLDSDLSGGFKKSAAEPPVWKRDSIELVLKTTETPNNKDYYRIAVGVQGLVFDSAYDDFELPVTAEGRPLGHLDFASNIESVAKVRGTIDDASDQDEGYTVELRVPWSAFEKKNSFSAAVDKSIWMNFAVHSDGESRGIVPYYSDQSLQVVRCFGKFVFAAANSPVAAQAQVQPLTADLPESLVLKQAAAAARVAAEAAAANAQKGAAAAASSVNPAAEGNDPPPAAAP